MTMNFEELAQGLFSLSAPAAAAQSALKNVHRWCEDESYRAYRPLIENLAGSKNWGELLDSFYRLMPFGTGGRRGAVGVGPNRINPVTFDLSVQGHCDYLRAVVGPDAPLSVVLAWDVRSFADYRGIFGGNAGVLAGLTSLDLARSAAEVYAANGIHVWVVGPMVDESPDLPKTCDYVSTPELSYLIRALRASGGLNVSASHNPPDDNGGKFYNCDGGQEVPPDDERLLQAVEEVLQAKKQPYARARAAGRIAFIPAVAREGYIAINKEFCRTASRRATIAFTPLNGVGSQSLYRALTELNFRVETVADEFAPDGAFPGVRYRTGNPEIPEVLANLAQVMLERGCTIGLATDPDADRLGLIVRTRDNRSVFFTGNEIGAVILQARISAARRAGALHARTLFINTVVTSSLQRVIAKRNGLQVVGDLMVGFKYMGHVLRCIERNGRYPGEQAAAELDRCTASPADFLFTTEEAHGFLLSPEVRDKDACGAGVFLAGLASDLADIGCDLSGYLHDIYKVYGYHAHVQRSLVMEGIDGVERMARIQNVLRKKPLQTVAGMAVEEFRDHRVYGGPLISDSDAANRNVLQFWLRGDRGETARLVVRPSGTEPKTKIYVEVPETRITKGIFDDTSVEQRSVISDAQLVEIMKETKKRAARIAEAFIRYCLGREIHGDDVGELPDELLLIPDMVPVDRKLIYCREILPAFCEQVRRGENPHEWLISEQTRLMGREGPAHGQAALDHRLQKEGLPPV